MDDNEFYKKWKTKSKSNHRLFLEKPDFSVKKLLQTDQIFSSTSLEDQTESFSLRLSESYIDDTQETSELKLKQNQVNEIIVISDSSSNESIFSYDESGNLKNSKNIKSQVQEGINILESSEDETCVTPVQHAASQRIQKINAISKTLIKDNTKNLCVKESDFENKQIRVAQVIKETVAENITLSERKKREILQWLSTNFDGSRCESSCSQESIILNSRKSDLSSGNSTLDRLELNFETPNNRGKLSKPNGITSKKIIHKESAKESIIDQYFTKSKKSQPHIVKDKMVGSRFSDKIPINIIKANLNKKITYDSVFLDSKSSENKHCTKVPVHNIDVSSRKKITSESESFDSKTPESNNSDEILISNIKTCSKRIVIPESEYVDSKTPQNNNSNISMNNIKKNSKNIIIPESNSFESNSPLNILKQNNLGDKNKTLTDTPLLQLSESISLKYNDNAKSLSNSPDFEIKNNANKKNVFATNNTTTNSTINDCADILENLYGKTWRDKASILICATEPKKKSKKFFKDVQTEKNITFRQPRYKWKSDKNLSDKENLYKNPTKHNKSPKRVKNINELKDSFKNDNSTTESSPDCSYYTALTNPRLSQSNQLKVMVSSTINVNDKNKKQEILAICELESDVDERNWKNRNNQRKLSYSSTSSSTSEFDPEDIVLPRIVPKPIKIKKFTKFNPALQKVNKQSEQDTKQSFLASLSKNVPLENADFKAMVYRVKYNIVKEELCKVLFKLFNEHVFDNQLPVDMLIEWSTRLRGTAGKCYNKQSLKAFNIIDRSSRIVLATKILDSPERLRDTLIHEMCHAATWLINNVSDGHGSFWKAWANKAAKVFPELPPISRCHNYEIQTKYTYKCTSCGYNIGRHSKSLDLSRKRCGYCHGRFELLTNKVTKMGKVQKKNTIQTKELCGFALYVKENYQLIKQSRSAIKHGDIMKILGKQFSAIKIEPEPEPEDYVSNYKNDPL